MLLLFAPGASTPATLPLDFTTGSLPTGVTASGGANGTRFNSSGVLVTGQSAPRFDYTSAGVSRGVLVEPAGTNLAFPWNDFSGWTANGYTYTANQTTSPDGTTDAHLLTSAGGPQMQLSFSGLTNAAAYVYSIAFKAGTLTKCFLDYYNGSDSIAYFDLSAVSVLATPTSCTAGIIDLGNGWRRVWLAVPSSIGIDGPILTFGGCDASGSRSSTSGGTIYVYGLDLKQATAYTTPVATTTAAVTRSADAISFTIPSGVTSLQFTFDDNSTQTVTGLTPGSTYTIPTTLNGSRIKTAADAAGGSVTLSPSAGSITLAGQTPALNTALNPGAGSVALTGQSAIVGRGLNPASGSVAVAGQSPALTTALNPATGAITVAGQAAIAGRGLNPATGAVTVSGVAATLTTAVNPAVGAVALTGQSPALTTALNPSAGAITVAGQTPAVVVNFTTTLTPSAGAITLAGQTPTLVRPQTVSPAAGAIALAGQTPSVGNNVTITASTGSVSLAGLTPTVTVAVTVNPASGAISITGQAAVIPASANLFPTTGSIIIAGQRPSTSGVRSLARAAQRIRSIA